MWIASFKFLAYALFRIHSVPSWNRSKGKAFGVACVKRPHKKFAVCAAGSCFIGNGTPMYDLQEMGGWKSVEMVRRYAHLAPAQIAKHAEVVGNLLNATNTAPKPEMKRAYDFS